MKIELMPNYPSDVKDYVNEYNNGVETKDINVVGTAVNSLVQFLFSSIEINRQAATHALEQIGNVQPGFLKSAVKTLVIRYKGTDESKKNFAETALEALFIDKKAEKLLADEPEILSALKTKKNQAQQQQTANKAQEAQLVQEIKKTGIDLSFISAYPELKTIGQFYNDSLLNKNQTQGINAVNSLINNLVSWHLSDRSKFIPGCLLLAQICNKNSRQTFIRTPIDELLKLYFKGTKEQKIAAEEIIESVLNEIIDLLPSDLGITLQGSLQRKQSERMAQKNKDAERSMIIGKMKIPISLGWETSIQRIAEEYNIGIAANNEKQTKSALNNLEKALSSPDQAVLKGATEIIGILVNKNPDYIKPAVLNILHKFEDEKNNIILGNIIDDIDKLKWADVSVVAQIRIKKNERAIEMEKQKQARQAEYARLEKIILKIDGDWQKDTTKLVEQINDVILKKDEKAVIKLINNELKKLIYAKDNLLRHEGQVVFARIAEKYPQFLDNLMNDLVPLYLSEVQQREIALDLFGLIFDLGFADKFFINKYSEVMQHLNADWANRKQEMENLELQKKWDAIKQDVTQLRINDAWKSSIQKIARDYNNAIKIKKMEEVMDAVRKIVEIFMKEKNEELQDQSTQVLGLIAKQNIELIQPTIDLFLQLIEGKDPDKKTRAIKGLGEVTRQRPGWSYFGIEKLVNLSQNDAEEDFRMKSLIEINRIAEKDAIMLIEYIPLITNSLIKDTNKHVRRLAALTLGNVAQAIATTTPEEQQKVITALTDALHDEYVLTRKFADNALASIREAMRKVEQ